MHGPRNRRAVLAGLTGAVTTVAGCGDGPAPLPGAPDGDRPTASPRSPEPLAVDGSWPQRGFDASHAGATAAIGVPDGGTAFWKLRRVRSGPAVLADGRLYHVGKIGADPSTTPTATRTRDEPVGTAHPVYGQPALFARDASDGTVEWTRPLDSSGVRWPAVDQDRVFLATPSAVVAVDGTDGTTVWREALDDRSVGPPTVAGDHVVVPVPGVVSGEEYVEEPAIVAYDAARGDRTWSIQPPKRHSRIAVADGTVFAVTEDFGDTGVLLALSLATGTERWRIDVSGGFFAEPVISDGTIIVGADDRLRAIESTDGSERWSTAVEGLAGVAANASTVVASGSSLHALSLEDATERWRSPFPQEEGYGSGRYVTPAIGGETVYAGTDGFPGVLGAFDVGSGEERWQTVLPRTVVEGDMVVAGLAAQPTVADGAVYAYAFDGLYAFGPE